jgi:hypothetical protein
VDPARPKFAPLVIAAAACAGRPGWDGNCAERAAPGAALTALTALTIDSGLRDVFALLHGRRALIEFLYANLRLRAR